MKTSNPGFFGSCAHVPVNAAAAKELGRPSAVELSTYSCPSIHPVSPLEIEKRYPNKNKFRDLTGIVLGESKIIGLHDFQTQGRSIWVVQCGCGRFGTTNHRILDQLAKRKSLSWGWICHKCNRLGEVDASPKRKILSLKK